MPSAVTIDWYIALSGILFVIGALGVLLRRNAIILFMSVELMLNSANLLFVAFARHLGDLDSFSVISATISDFFGLEARYGALSILSDLEELT